MGGFGRINGIRRFPAEAGQNGVRERLFYIILGSLMPPASGPGVRAPVLETRDHSRRPVTTSCCNKQSFYSRSR